MVAWLRNNAYVRWLLTVVRIWIGIEWIQAAMEKIGSPVWTGSKAGVAISGFLGNAVKQSQGAHPAVQGWYASFLKGFALPHATLFSYAVSYGELLVSIGLVLGCLTTAAAFFGAVMNLSYLLAGTTSTNPNMLLWQVLLLVAGFNAAMIGLDYWLIPYLRQLAVRIRHRGGSRPAPLAPRRRKTA
ncbi:MAG: DoxX family protein [Alicyclobacillus herbarius]|uniref:DoxX family membrane protein n=1 Tax=Alicyclobacillus herbarius TaxID=122960 RepID=UPI002357A02B|nr:DoxX family protein [Alicyclobacillus herbarius]MCL6631742.1 DoxX family protein [Alicyclobacillus herbarius]